MERRRAAPKRRAPRRERAARRELRTAAAPEASVAPAAAVAAPLKPGEFRAQMSYWGLAGGLWATSTFGLLTVLATVDPKGNSRWLAVLFGSLTLLFVPAVVFSILPGERRREAVLRFETALCLALAFLGIFVLGDIGWPIILSPPTILLATGAGLVFTGGRRKAS